MWSIEKNKLQYVVYKGFMKNFVFQATFPPRIPSIPIEAIKKPRALKIFPLYSNEKQLVRKAIQGHRGAQGTLYGTYAPKMLGLCRQYIRDLHFAEDVMINGFVKVFDKLESFENRGSFEGWIRRIMVRECIDHLRKRQFVVYDGDVFEAHADGLVENGGLLDLDRVQQLIDALPEGYRTVFLLHAVEGHGHREIAQMLGISEGTSKSQLSKARKMLRDNLKLKGITSQSGMGQ